MAMGTRHEHNNPYLSLPGAMLRLMGNLLKLIWRFVVGLLRSRAALEAEIVALRHQLNMLGRKAPRRLVFSNFDRLVFASLYRLVPVILNALVIDVAKDALKREADLLFDLGNDGAERVAIIGLAG
jgi:hypothetical protein